MTIYDPDARCHIEVESCHFTGPQATCTLLSPEGRQVRGNYLSDAAPAAGGMSHVRYKSKGSTTLVRSQQSKCRCGNRKPASARQCRKCHVRNTQAA